MRSVLSIAGSDTSGGAGVAADLRAFTYVGVHGCTVITCLTSQNTKEVRNIHPVPLDVIEEQLDAIFGDIQIASCKTGMLYSSDIVKMVSEKVGGKEFPLIVDPVMKATVGGDLSQSDFMDALKEYLIPKATLLTPNIPEAQTIIGREIKSIDEMREAAKKIQGLGCQSVLLKGGHLEGNMASDVLYDGKEFHLYLSSYHPKEVHGSGCMHSALITAYLAKGLTIPEAQSEAKIHIANLIESGYSIGGGTDVVGIPLPSYSPQELEVLDSLESVLHVILEVLPFTLVPEVGINFGYALPFAETPDDVCALEGRLIRVGHSIGHLGEFKFGASKHIARIILTAMKFNPESRSAMNIKYSPQIIDQLNSLEFSISSFDRGSEPKETSSMEWGTESAIKEFGSVPDIIYDEGEVGKEPMVRILGKNPEDVLGKLKKIVDKIKTN